MIKRIDLGGEWRVLLDKSGEFSTVPESGLFTEKMTLPGTTSAAGIGELNERRETGFLTDTRIFEGYAWFTREIDLTDVDGTAELFLERTRITFAYVDGELIGMCDSLTAPHVYDLSSFAGGKHTLTVKVLNTHYPTGGGHLTSPDTQTNWNGITGDISVRVYGAAHAETVRVDPLFDERAFRIRAKIAGAESGKATVTAESFNCPEGIQPHKPESVTALFTGGELLCTLPLGNDARTWDEYRPELYRITIDIDSDITTVTTGMREFKTDGGKFVINGRRTFLRGKHDGMIFPKTGYAPTDVDEWVRVLRISKSYGMNHYRFHTCCPPEAAFAAADIVGIYMEPQLPFWGTIQAPGEEGFNKDEQEYLIKEGFRMLENFGNHPSFCMMSMGNELWGSPERINDIVGGYKSVDRRHLYTQGSNNFQWFPNVQPNDDYFVGVRLANDRLIRGSYAMCDAPLGHIQTDKPSTMHNYDSVIRPEKQSSATETSGDGTVQIQFGTTTKTVKATDADADFVPEIPIVTHEIGQFETFPNFDEIEKYTGSIKARNFEIFRERLDEKGLLPLAKDYFEASGALAVQCYKEEMEAVFRSEGLGGFQILDIQDFSGQGTALVGVLDAFMDEKGICSPEEWREFCNDTVIFAEFADYCLEGGSEFFAKIRLTNFRPEGIAGRHFTARLICQGGHERGLLEGTVPNSNENYITLGTLSARLPEPKAAKRFRLELSVDGTDVRNHYELMVYPKQTVQLPDELIFNELNDTAEKLLSEGKTILLTPPLTEENSVEGFYCTDFWCYPMFRSISESMGKPTPVGTMGLLIDTEHPALADFPCRKYSEPQWYSIVSNSRSEILDGADDRAGKRVIVRTIDNFERNHDLALMYEYEKNGGKVLVLGADLNKLKTTPEGRQFLRSVGKYLTKD